MDDPRASSFLARATRAISNQLELSESSARAHRNAPPPPSHWAETAHRRHLVRLWDLVDDQASRLPQPLSTSARLVSTQKSMLHAFPELGRGERVLTRDWIEYVLGVALKHPFCTAEGMGRWELLASTGGARGNWGPW